MPDFVSRTPNRGLTRLNMQQQTNQQLLQDAFSLSPDVDAVSKAVLDKKLYNADMAPVQAEVSGIISQYMDSFNKDPFYAFSREGRKTAGVLKEIINHPSVREWEQNTAKAEEEYKRASDNRLNKNLVVRGNDVLAVKEGRRQYISMNDIKSLNPDKGDRLLDVDSDITGIRNTYGVRNGVPSYDMTKLDDIDVKVKNAFSDLGSTDTSGLVRDSSEGADLKQRRKSNENQLQIALKTFMKTGLTESDKNTLRSEYIKANGGESSYEGFHKWLSGKLSGIASGKITTVREDLEQESIASKAKSGAAPKTVELSAASKIIQGVTGNRKVVDVIGNAGQSLQGNLLPPQETLSLSSGTAKDELGNTYPNRTVKNLKVFSDATDLKNLSVRNEKSGAWERLPALAEHGVVVDKPGSEPALVWQYTYTDPTGEAATVPVAAAKEIMERRNSGRPIPENLQKYMTTLPVEQAEQNIIRSSAPDEVKQKQILALRSQASQDGLVRMMENKPWVDFSVVIPKAKGIFNSNITGEEQEIGKRLSDFGYRSQESGAMNDYHMKYSGRGNVADPSGFPHPFSVADEFYEAKARVPLTSFEQLNSVYGGKTLGYTQDVHIDSSRLRDNYELFSPELFNSSTIPNMAGKRAKVTIDDIQ